MESELVWVDREALLAELGRVFDAQTAETLLRVLDKVAAQVRAAGVTREDFGELQQIVAELAEIQRRCGLHLEHLKSALGGGAGSLGHSLIHGMPGRRGASGCCYNEGAVT